jgi:hypothetical protein
MAEPRRPYYVWFSNDRIPQQVDHSRSQPGPTGGTANRAGFTSVTSRARMTIAWSDEPVALGGLTPLYARSVNVYFWLTDFLVAISADFAARSCAYRVTRAHELSAHINDPIRIFHSYRDVLIRRLNVIVVPTQAVPLRVASRTEAEVRQTALETMITNAIVQTREELVRALRRARDQHDSADAYRLVYNQCSPAEWISGR